MEYHIPVLSHEVVELLTPTQGKTFVDCTLGGGGHSLDLLKAGANVIALDQDIDAINFAKKKLLPYSKQIKYHQINFKDLEQSIKNKVDGFLFDLGVSSYQIDTAERGFSLKHEGPLDMRMSKEENLTAEQIVNQYSEEELINIFKNYGEEKFSKRIARNIIHQRKKENIQSTQDLVKVIKFSSPTKNPVKLRDIYTRIFQALRIEVNQELKSLEKALKAAINLTLPGGKIIAISYHSLEDRIVKNIFKTENRDCLCDPRIPKCICNHKRKIKIMNKKPITASKEEINNNPRSRSAKLRAAQKLTINNKESYA